MLNFEWTAAKFFWYLYITCTSLTAFTYYGMMMVSITPNLILATVSSTFFYTIFNLYSGFLIPRPVSRFLLPTQTLCTSIQNHPQETLFQYFETLMINVPVKMNTVG